MSEPEKTARLVWMNGQEIKQQWILAKPVTRIGRSEDNDVVAHDRCVSRHHARIRCTGDQHTIRDLGSKNGILINGRPIADVAVLSNEDEIRLAPAFTLTFVDPGSEIRLQTGESVRSLELDPESRQARIRGTFLRPPLSRAQFTFLALLAEQPGRVYSRNEIISAVWPNDEAEGISNAAMDALVRRTRLRLRELDPEQPYILTVRGHGFRLEANHGLAPHLGRPLAKEGA